MHFEILVQKLVRKMDIKCIWLSRLSKISDFHLTSLTNEKKFFREGAEPSQDAKSQRSQFYDGRLKLEGEKTFFDFTPPPSQLKT